VHRSCGCGDEAAQEVLKLNTATPEGRKKSLAAVSTQQPNVARHYFRGRLTHVIYIGADYAYHPALSGLPTMGHRLSADSVTLVYRLTITAYSSCRINRCIWCN
jgi:hypothetical protein